MRKSLNFLFFIFIAALPLDAQNMLREWERIVDSAFAAHPKSIGLIYHIEIPEKQISWTYAVGYTDSLKQESLNSNQPILVASNTKTFVAATILKLVEKGYFKLDDSIENLISLESKILLQSDQYDLSKITVRHLLSHTSGITDYVDKDYFDFIGSHSKLRWTRDAQIKRTVELNEKKAEPGENYSYADVNYLLLTEIMESQNKKDFTKTIRILLDFKQYNLNNTWFETLEKRPSKLGQFPHQCWTSRGFDSHNFDPSWDLYGGGGIASTTKEMALFFDALFRAKLILNPDLLNEMTRDQGIVENSKYGLGIMSINFFGEPMFYHGGFWGTDVMYSPDLKASFSAVCLEKDEREINAQISKRFIQILKAHQKK